MAEEIVFDSERFAKKQTIKRWLIPAIALLAIVLIAAALALVFRGGGRKYTGGEETPYPYTWRAGKNGVISLELDRSAAPDCLWTAAGPDPLMDVAETQDAEEQKTQFVLTPLAAGRTVLTFSLLRNGDETDCIYELSVLAEVAENGKSLSSGLISFSGKELPGVVRGGTDTDYPYLLYTDADGDMRITVITNAPAPDETAQEDADSDDKGSGWSCVCENESIAKVIGVITREDAVTAYLRPGTTPGTVRVQMTDSVSGTELSLELETDGSGSIRLLTHELYVR
jgi:hypothetical protein